MSAEPRITRVSEVPPDPSIASAVGRHHSLETAIADLVDNSIDAEAGNVRLRFIQRAGGIVGLRVIDDGRGMDTSGIDAAMTFAKKREYGASDLGHFGLGLKAASLSQAGILRVYSRRIGGVPTGRAISGAKPTAVSHLDTDDVGDVLRDIRVDFTMASGTVVEWAEPRTFLTSTDTSDRAKWLDARVSSLMSHLGIVFHRKLASGAVTISIDVFDADYGEAGIARDVVAIDPFGYVGIAGDDYPAVLRAEIDGGEISGTVHLWPAAQTGRPEFRLGGRPGALFQGFYFYRADRLLQGGGWNTLTVERPELELARVSIDIDEVVARHITINPEKAGLELDDDLRQALRAATVGAGQSFADFIDRAEDTRREARKYTKRPVELVEPLRGFDREMLAAFEESVDFTQGKPVDIRWKVMAGDEPFVVDLERRTVWLNDRYRDVIVGAPGIDNDDAPLVKTLLLVVLSKYFEGSHLGSREKAELGAWSRLLGAALRSETERRSEREAGGGP